MLSIQLVKLTELDMDLTSNPNLIHPPRETVIAGGSAIRNWLSSYFYGDPYPRLRLFMLGHGGACHRAA